MSEFFSFFSSLVSSMESLLSSFNSRLSKIFWSKFLPFTFAIHSRTSIASSRRPCRKSHLWSFQNINLMTAASFWTVISGTVTDAQLVLKAPWPWGFWYQKIISTKTDQNWRESHSHCKSPVTKHLSWVSEWLSCKLSVATVMFIYREWCEYDCRWENIWKLDEWRKQIPAGPSCPTSCDESSNNEPLVSTDQFNSKSICAKTWWKETSKTRSNHEIIMIWSKNHNCQKYTEWISTDQKNFSAPNFILKSSPYWLTKNRSKQQYTLRTELKFLWSGLSGHRLDLADSKSVHRSLVWIGIVDESQTFANMAWWIYYHIKDQNHLNKLCAYCNLHIQLYFYYAFEIIFIGAAELFRSFKLTKILVTTLSVVDGFGQFCHQHPLSF